MKFNISGAIDFNAQSDGTIVLNVHALRTPRQTVISESFTTNPYIKTEEFTAAPGENRLARFEIAGAGRVSIVYEALVDNYCETIVFDGITDVAIASIEPTVLPYLYPSRYCQSDKLYRLAHNLFGHINEPFEKVVALTEWIYKNVQYLSGSTNANTSAFDTVTEQSGVCRDFAHLGVALCRALTIPARYFTGYAWKLKPADFHACFEAYLGGKWVLFDATRLVPLNGMIKIATGRDAADTALANIFGDVMLTGMQVSCTLAEDGFEPFYGNDAQTVGISYL